MASGRSKLTSLAPRAPLGSSDRSGTIPSDRQTELRLGLEFAVQRGQRDPQKPDWLGDRHLALQETDRQTFQFAAARDRDGYGFAARDDLEVIELHLQGHRAAARALVFAVPPDLVDQRLQFGDHGVELG